MDLDSNWEFVRLHSVDVGGDRYDLESEALERTKSLELQTLHGKVWQPATLPHCAWIRPIGSSDIWQGIAYYRRILPRPPGSSGKLVQLTIEGAMQDSDLWLNGKHIASRKGGYLPLEADITPWLKDRNEILVRVDNQDNPLIPPGKPQQELDFMYGAGIYRNARLTVTDRLRITDPILENLPRNGGIYVTYPVVGEKSATIRVRTHVRNSHSAGIGFVISQNIIDEKGNLVAKASAIGRVGSLSAEQFTQDLVVQHPMLWSPRAPNLYRLETLLISGGGIEDSTATKIGIRKIEISRERGFVLNGIPIRLVGTNRHQDYPWVGPALSDEANARDALQIKRAGHNIVRLSHYPQSTAFLDECDRIGLMVIPCIPGWQFMNSDSRFVSRVGQDIRELIRRDRNHPSAVFWETSLNETYPPVAIAKQWDSIAKSEAADGNIFTAGDAAKGANWDVAYNQWKDDLSRPQVAAPDKPGYIREYGDYEFGGATSSSRVRIGQGVDKLLQETWNHVWSHNKFRSQYPWTMGDGTWEMFDHNVPWEFKISASGLSDIFRRPKPSYWFYASQTTDRPMIKIANTWQPGAAFRDVIVFSNCEEVGLSVNGRLFARIKPERGPLTNYDKAKPFDGSNTSNLEHPPFVFRNVPFAVGELTAVGFVQHAPVARDVVTTAGSPIGLKLWVDDLGIRPQANDLVFVRAAFVDRYGNVDPTAVGKIRFQVTGAVLGGESTNEAEMGIASTLIRTSANGNSFSVRASTITGLTGGLEFVVASK